MSESFYSGMLRHSSLEVALGALLMSCALADTFGVVLPLPVCLALFFAVWFIYLLDRLFDAKKIQGPATNPRHLFYQRYHARLSALLMLAGLAGLLTVPFLPADVLTYGLMLMGVCLLYLLGVFLTGKKLPKEVLIAVLYSAGVVLAPAVFASEPLDEFGVIVVPAIFLIALCNLLLFSKAEAPYDKTDGQASIVTDWCGLKLDRLIKSVFVLAAIFIIALAFSAHSQSQIAFPFVLLFMTAILWVLHLRAERFKSVALFRWIGDGVFLLPVILLLL